VAQVLQNGDQIGHAGSIPCGLRVRWNRRYDQQLHSIAFNCRLEFVITGSKEILVTGACEKPTILSDLLRPPLNCRASGFVQSSKLNLQANSSFRSKNRQIRLLERGHSAHSMTSGFFTNDAVRVPVMPR